MLVTQFLTAAAALAAVLAMVLLAARALRRWGPTARAGSPGKRMVLQETLALDAKRRLHLVRCDGRSLVLLTGGASDVAVGWGPPE